MRKCATERARIESSRGKAIYLAIFQHPASFRRMLVVERARPGSAAGHGHEPEDGAQGRGGKGKGDGGISQGISGISPRGGLVNCSEGMEGRSEEGGGGGEVDGVWVYQFRGQKRVSAERPRENERAESESGDTNHGRVTDLRRLTGQPRPSTTADAFVRKKKSELSAQDDSGTMRMMQLATVPLTSLEPAQSTWQAHIIRHRIRIFFDFLTFFIHFSNTHFSGEFKISNSPE